MALLPIPITDSEISVGRECRIDEVNHSVQALARLYDFSFGAAAHSRLAWPSSPQRYQVGVPLRSSGAFTAHMAFFSAVITGRRATGVQRRIHGSHGLLLRRYNRSAYHVLGSRVPDVGYPHHAAIGAATAGGAAFAASLRQRLP